MDRMSAGGREVPRILCIMGSGETAPTMSAVHAHLLARMGAPPVPAVLLDTPFGFQENAGDICRRAMSYFEQSVGHPIEVASYRNAETATQREYEAMLARIADARYAFAGPGSPTYALRQWRGSKVPALLEDKLRTGGCVTFASAAAVTLGVCAVPVYEVYKVGEAPHWLEGLDLLSVTGLRAAVIPHFDNAEGGTHDTRYCYLGERRLRMLEAMLPEDVDVLGVDEHTACIFDLEEQRVSVRGRGGVTWRHRGGSRRFEAGTEIPVEELRSEGAVESGGSAPAPSETRAAGPVSSSTPFGEEVAAQRRIAEEALAGGDVDSAVEAVLEIDTRMHAWASDTLDSDERDLARASLREYVVRLGEVARLGAADPRDRVAPLVDPLLRMRRELRSSGHYELADRLRDVLVGAGVEVRDTPDGTTWQLMDGGAAPVA